MWKNLKKMLPALIERGSILAYCLWRPYPLPRARPLPRPSRRPGLPAPLPRRSAMPRPGRLSLSLTLLLKADSGLHLPIFLPVIGPSFSGPVLSNPGIITSFLLFVTNHKSVTTGAFYLCTGYSGLVLYLLPAIRANTKAFVPGVPHFVMTMTVTPLV